MWDSRRRYEEGYEPRPFNSDTDDSQAQRDRARVIHSASFRRLQAKTQVLGVGEGDFYRTRLTHSMEVAQIGSSICESLRHKHATQDEILNWIPSLSQIEAIGLSHDIGHPPFGHGGEVALNYHMTDSGGFEGNGQTLRIVSKLGEYSPSHGLDLTRRTMLGLLKYPALHSEVCNYPKDLSDHKGTNIEVYKPPKCIHDDESDILDWILKPLNDDDRKKFLGFRQIEGKHSKTQYKSFDTTIMELADDIAYGVHDLEDALALELVSQRRWKDCVVEHLSESCDIYKQIDFFDDKLFSGSKKDLKHAISKMVNYFVQNISISENREFENPLLRYQAVMSDTAKNSLELLKRFVLDDVIYSPEVQVLEFKGQQLIKTLFEVLSENPKRLLPRSTFELYKESECGPRVICDYIAGMSDDYATKLYHKLFSPSIGSIFDKM